MSNTFRTTLAVAACKGARGMLRVLKKGGTTVPGKIAMKIDSGILSKVSEGMEIIVVTGTNGKTTTSNMLEHALTSSGRDTLANRSGANLLPGVVAEFTANASASGHPKKKYAVVECDEAALKLVVPQIHPKVILVTNLFRDQLDRYGEVMHTRDEIRKGIEKCPDAVLCLNADDSLVVSLADNVPNKVVWYGIDIPVGPQKEVQISDARYCIHCGTEYEYDYHTYAHLGGFRCPKCGYSRPKTDVAVTDIAKQGMTGSDVSVRFGSDNYSVHVGLPAVYNIYNAAGAIAAYTAAGFDKEEIFQSLADVHSSFGRMETFDLDGAHIQMILVKNPAGCNQALSYVSSTGVDYNACFCLNDRTADGHDISWIWDADFESVCADPHLKKVLVSGDRAEDMLLRLKYAGLGDRSAEIVHTNKELIERFRKSELPVFVLPNYTSMLSLRADLSEITGKSGFWEG
ncbi:MAG: MurT ligase domain-containing protein [Bilifractor sp.]|jgi:UDP-N-acetylmuramyl tripeptide synthase